jgi:ketosteroid isomerase-like protein
VKWRDALCPVRFYLDDTAVVLPSGELPFGPLISANCARGLIPGITAASGASTIVTFARAVTNNNANAVDGFLADDWIIVDPDGSIIDKARFLGVIKSGALSHELMESADLRVRLYGNTAVVTGLTTTKGKFMGQDFASCERATDIFVKQNATAGNAYLRS